jgi:chloramphenicol O-acetyltransferase
MAKRRYPRIGQIEKVENNKNPLCSACKEKAINYVHMQYTCMRGDDDVFSVCESHLLVIKNNFDEFYKDFSEEKHKRNPELLAEKNNA